MGNDFQNLIVWQKAASFYVNTIKLLKTFPKEERNCLIDQMSRAALSISNNIAEGCGRRSDKEIAHFFQISFGSAKEVKSMFLISQKLNYVNNEDISKLLLELDEIEKMLFCLIKSKIN